VSGATRPKATVSTPLEWTEVNERLDPGDFTIHSIPDRVKEKGDLWEPFRKTNNSLAQFLK
ncbi:MAG: hypothetical protein FWJ85_13245, partial [Solitalea sp.]